VVALQSLAGAAHFAAVDVGDVVLVDAACAQNEILTDPVLRQFDAPADPHRAVAGDVLLYPAAGDGHCLPPGVVEPGRGPALAETRVARIGLDGVACENVDLFPDGAEFAFPVTGGKVRGQTGRDRRSGQTVATGPRFGDGAAPAGDDQTHGNAGLPPQNVTEPRGHGGAVARVFGRHAPPDACGFALLRARGAAFHLEETEVIGIREQFLQFFLLPPRGGVRTRGVARPPRGIGVEGILHVGLPRGQPHVAQEHVAHGRFLGGISLDADAQFEGTARGQGREVKRELAPAGTSAEDLDAREFSPDDHIGPGLPPDRERFAVLQHGAFLKQRIQTHITFFLSEFPAI